MQQRKFEKYDIEDGYEADTEEGSLAELRIDVFLANVNVLNKAKVRINTVDEYYAVLNALAKNPLLKELDLRGSYLGEKSLANLGKALLHNTHLARLNIKVHIGEKEHESQKFLLLFKFNTALVEVNLRCPENAKERHEKFSEKLQDACIEKRLKARFFKKEAAKKAAKKERHQEQKAPGLY